MLQLSSYLGRFKDNPELTEDLLKNAKKTIARASELCQRFDPKFNPVITSGFRPVSYNKSIGGSQNSKHCFCNAVDIWDPEKKLGLWCLQNIETLKELGLYMESLVTTHSSDDKTKLWVHLQCVAPKSGSIVFTP